MSITTEHDVRFNIDHGKRVIKPVKPRYDLVQLICEHKSLNLPTDDEWIDFVDFAAEQLT